MLNPSWLKASTALETSILGVLSSVNSGIGGGGFDPASAFADGQAGLWWDNDPATMYSDSGMTTLAVVNGPVLKIADKSGNGHHATCTNCTLRQSGDLYYLEATGASTITAAFTGTSSMFASLAAYRDADDASSVLAYSDPNKYFGVAISGDTQASFINAGIPLYAVNGPTFELKNRAEFDVAFALASPAVVQVTGVDLTGWTEFSMLGFNTVQLKGRFYGALLVESISAAAIDGVRQYQASTSGATVTAGSGLDAIALGDSTVATYTPFFNGVYSVMDYVQTTSVKRSLAVAGHTIAQQKTVWAATPYKATARWVVVEVGLNDLDPAEAASVAIARLQDLVDTVQAGVSATCKVLIAQMTPCRARLISVYGGVNGPIAYLKWLAMNTAIAGNGATPITGVDGRITAHVALLNDGSGNLAGAYDSGDGIHENNAGRQIIADAWETALTALGVL